MQIRRKHQDTHSQEDGRNAFPSRLFKRGPVFYISITILVAIIVLAGAYWTLRYVLKEENPFALSLTFVGGVGAVVAMVVSYRKQRLAEYDSARQDQVQSSEERARDNRQIAEYAAMLSTQDPTKVSAALLGISTLSTMRSRIDTEENTRIFDQMCVGIICSFIRTEGDAPEDRVARAQANQREAFRTIRSHCSKKSEHSWSSCDFDFDETRFLVDINLDVMRFDGRTRFRKAVFDGSFSALAATFADARFDGAKFKGRVDFTQCHFTKASFGEQLEFWKEASFFKATFDRGVVFGITIHEEDHYWRIPSSGTLLTFHGKADFMEAEFDGVFWLELCDFLDWAIFRGVKTKGRLRVSNCKFRDAYFSSASLGEACAFNDVSVSESLHLNDIRFSDTSPYPYKCDFHKVRASTWILDGTEFPDSTRVSDCEASELIPPSGQNPVYDYFKCRRDPGSD